MSRIVRSRHVLAVRGLEASTDFLPRGLPELGPRTLEGHRVRFKQRVWAMFARAIAIVFVALMSLSGCRTAPVAPSTCDLPEKLALDVRGRADGVYGVVGEEIAAAPLVHFDRLRITEEGIDSSSGKRWLRLHVDEPDATKLEEFSSPSDDHSIAVVIASDVAAHHKLRTRIESGAIQLSCCNPLACDAWRAAIPRR